MFNDEYRRAALGALFILLALQEPARADNGPELWTQLETRLTVSEEPSLWPQAYRVIAVNFFGERFPGLGQSLFRAGPIWNPHSNVSLAFNVVTGVEQDRPGNYAQQLRAELEPTVRWSLWGVAFNDRNRLEHRWSASGQRWRYRNQLRASLPALGWDWTPYVSNEVFYDLTASAFNQDRLIVGLSRDLSKEVRMDASYVVRFRLTEPDWERDHALSLSLTFNLRPGS
jgi:hypothetical protein